MHGGAISILYQPFNILSLVSLRIIYCINVSLLSYLYIIYSVEVGVRIHNYRPHKLNSLFSDPEHKYSRQFSIFGNYCSKLEPLRWVNV